MGIERLGRLIGSACLIALCVMAGAAHAQVEPSSWPPQAQSEPSSDLPSSAVRHYLMTFHDAPVEDVADAVLGDALHAPYLVGPRVAGSMNFEVDERLTPLQLLNRFEAALRSSGVAIRATESQFVLMPASEVTAPAPPAASPPPPQTAMTPVKKQRSEWWRLSGLLATCAVAGAVSAMVMTWRRRALQGSAAREAVLAYLLESQAVSVKQIARARLVASRESRTVESVLERDAPLASDVLAEAYAAALGLAIWRPAAQPPLDPQPRFGAEAMDERILALVDDGVHLTVATTDPLDDAATARVLFASGRTIRLTVASERDMTEAQRALRSLHVVGLVAG